METRSLPGKIEEPVKANNRYGGSPEIQEACQSGGQTWRRGERGHGHDLPYRFERESTVQSARVENQQILCTLFRLHGIGRFHGVEALAGPFGKRGPGHAGR